MAQDQFQMTLDGQGIVQPDANAVFREAALADDVVLHELLHLAPFDPIAGAVAKAIVSYGVAGSNAPMVAPFGATGQVLLQPFRAVVGSRSAVSAAVGSALLNWNDVRSKVYAVTADNATLGQPVSFVPNTSGSPRWDVIYAQIAIDQNNPNVTRNVRAPGSAATLPPTSRSIVPSLTQAMTIGVQEGTPAASPVFPALPGDTVTANGTFYIPIAAVLIPSGFGATTIVLSEWIVMRAPIVPLSLAFGGVDSRPPNRLAAALATSAIQTWASSGTRPAQALPCTRQGGLKKRFGLDATTATPLIADAGVLDDAIDYRGRDFTVRCSVWPGATQFAWQPGATSGAIPQPTGATTLSQDGASMVDNSAAILGVTSRNAGVVFFANHAALAPVAAGANAIGLYVDLATGALRVFYQGTPGCLFIFTVEGTAPFDNL